MRITMCLAWSIPPGTLKEGRVMVDVRVWLAPAREAQRRGEMAEKTPDPLITFWRFVDVYALVGIDQNAVVTAIPIDGARTNDHIIVGQWTPADNCSVHAARVLQEGLMNDANGRKMGAAPDQYFAGAAGTPARLATEVSSVRGVTKTTIAPTTTGGGGK